MTAENPQTETVPTGGNTAAKPSGSHHSQVKISKKELEDLKLKAEENWDKFLRATAELENYRKRVAREKEELARHTSERVVAALLPVLDNLERAIAASTESSALVEGLKQVQAQFRRTLEQFGLQEVLTGAGHAFDPTIHEAVGQIESEEHPEGVVLEQLQRGYKFSDRLLRPARVIVSKGKPSNSSE